MHIGEVAKVASGENLFLIACLVRILLTALSPLAAHNSSIRSSSRLT